MECVNGGHIVSDDLAVGDLGGKLGKILRPQDVLEVLPIVLATRPRVGGGLELAVVQVLVPVLLLKTYLMLVMKQLSIMVKE